MPVSVVNHLQQIGDTCRMSIAQITSRAHFGNAEKLWGVLKQSYLIGTEASGVTLGGFSNLLRFSEPA